MVTEN